MYKSKLINILKTISNKELKKFNDYLMSPFFNKNEKVIKLFHELKPLAPNYDEQAVERTRIFPKIFGKEPFEEPKLRYVMADLTKLLENFLSYQQYQESEGGFYKNFFLLKAYVEKDLDKYFNSVWRLQEGALQKSVIRDNKHYFHQYLLDSEKYLFSSIRSNHISDEVRNKLSKSLIDNLDVFYISNKLKYICEFYNTGNVLSSDVSNPVLYEEIITYVESLAEPAPSIAIYYKILMTLVDSENEEHFNGFLQYLYGHTAFFTEDELYDIYTFGHNYCARKYNSGHINYLGKLFELYKISIEKKILLPKNVLAEQHYKNISQIALFLGEMEFAEDFIYKYRDYVRIDLRKNAFTYNLANLHFHKKDYNEAISLMQEVEFNDTYYHLDTKILLVRCYYELDELMPLFYAIDALKAFIKRNKHMSKFYKTNYLTNIKFLQKLARIRGSHKRTRDKALAKLKQELQESRAISSRWISEKIAELEADINKRG